MNKNRLILILVYVLIGTAIVIYFKYSSRLVHIVGLTIASFNAGRLIEFFNKK